MNNGIARSVVKNTSIMMGQLMITWASTLILVVFLARYLGPVEYGRLFLANSIVAIFRIFVEYGGNYLIAKKIARNPETAGQTIIDGISYRLVFGMLALIGTIAAAILGNYPSEVRMLITIVGVSLLWKGAMTVLVAGYQGRETMQYTSIGSITEAVVMSAASVIALLMGEKAVTIAVISVIAGFLNFCMLFAFSKKISAVFPRMKWSDASSQIKEGVPYFLMAIFATIYYRIDSLMLSKMAPEQVVGWYGASYRLFDVLNFFPYIFTTAIFPVLSRLWEQETDSHKRMTQRSIEFMVLLGIPVTVGGIAFAADIVQLVYGVPAYEQSIVVFRVLTLGIVFLFADMVIGTTLMASNKQRQQSLLALCAIAINVGLNLVLIPLFQRRFENGGIGAGIATVLTELFIMITGVILLPKGIFSGFRASVPYKSAAAGVVMALFIAVCAPLHIPPVILAVLSSLVYVSALLGMKTFDEAERKLFADMMTMKNLRTVITGKTTR